jgi:signal transduction histidine kinase
MRSSSRSLPPPDLPLQSLQLAGINGAAGGRDTTGLAVARSALLLDALSEISAGENDDAMLQALTGKLRWLIGFVRVDLARTTDDGRSYRLRTLFEAQPDIRPPAADTLPITEGPAASVFASGRSWLITTDDSAPLTQPSALAVLLDSGEPHLGAVIFHTREPDGFTTEEIGAARMVGQHLGFALARSTLVARLRAEAERRTAVEVELRQAAALAEAGNRAKDDFLAIVSHELRTPLTSIVGWVAMLRSGKLPADDVAKALATLDRNVKLQTRLVDDLIDASRIVTGKLQCVSSEFDLRSAVTDTVDAYRGGAEASGILLTLDVPPQAVRYVGDAERLQQVVGNLLSNAVKFTPSGRGIEVHMERTASIARISVRDHGRGIESSFLPHIFEAFRQEEVGKTRTHGGLGLGLTIARHLVELHGGAIHAESAGIGLGATMTVELPLTA